ncbi:predicted protein [Nematostella vectensis]|uniref:BHLH domain-containing protein n=1 Tax=Nematostella vectensis TaxID=45351 RepID=A7RYX2_NEMVE|nr:predicted protein [Nematostella vectensis]|eukprot:XP_001635325.1 predicted protein [Nematostella vectensis]
MAHVSDESQPETHDFVGKMINERRKTKKPLMEKLRRDRINNSLNEMKLLVLESLNKDVSRYSKMEKADILEMTVKFLKEVNRQDSATNGAQSWSDYKAGYNRRGVEVMPNISTTNTPTGDLTGKFYTHLTSCHGNGHVQTHPTAAFILNNVAPSLSGTPVGIATGKIPTVVWFPLPSPPQSPSNTKALFCPSMPVQLTPEKSGHDCLKRTESPAVASKLSLPGSVTPAMWRPW